MTHSHFLRAAANQHFKTADRLRTSTFETVTAAARSTREKTALLRKRRMDQEDADAAIRLPDMTGRASK